MTRAAAPHGRKIEPDTPLPRDIPVIVALGGNLGSPETIRDRFVRARDLLAEALASPWSRLSPLYLSDPVGPVRDQPRFLNGAAHFTLGRPLSPAALLAEILAVEATLGRVRDPAAPQGPRTIDLDLLLAGDARVAGPDIEVPHPRMGDRAFVLRPVADLLGRSWPVPGTGRTIGDHLDDPAVAAQDRGLTPCFPGDG